MPDTSPAGFAVILILAGVVPLVALSVSQLVGLAPSAMVNACAEPSEDEMTSVLVTGGDELGSTNTALPVIWRVACGCVTATVTATVADVNPAAETVMAPV